MFDNEDNQLIPEEWMQPFDLEKAKAGALVCTFEGHKVRIICFNRDYNYQSRRLIYLYRGSYGYEYLGFADESGVSDTHSKLKLYKETKTYWGYSYINMYGEPEVYTQVFNSFEEVKVYVDEMNKDNPKGNRQIFSFTR